MIHNVDIHDFKNEIECIYKDERYLVRDNGAVFRLPINSKRIRPLDKQWTFGKPNFRNGYIEIACIPIHRIVAIAFLGPKPTENHVVDHIDTNRHNNRPENLRWVTRLENILLNPITAKRIASVCGSVEAFLEDPSKFFGKFQDPNYNWMTTVSKEDAQVSLERMLTWAKADNVISGGTLGDWIYNRTLPVYEPVNEIIGQEEEIKAKTFNATQRNWKTPSEFPCCPHDNSENPLLLYTKNLKEGAIFCTNDIYSSTVLKKAFSDKLQSIFVISENEDGIKRWALAKITFENDLFVHTSLHNFFTLDGAEKQYTLAQGFEWFGEDSIDDYC